MIVVCRRLVHAALLVVLAAACGRPASPTPVGFVPAEWPLGAKVQPVTGAQAMVVSGSPIASAVGVEVLRQGGNAVDAAVAVGFALTVVHPEAGNIGGGGFMVIRLADGRVRTLDYREMAPGRSTHDMYLDSTGAIADTLRSVTGHLSSGVPGSVAGLTEAARHYGTVPLARLLEPAIRYAREGFVLDSFRFRSINGSRARLKKFETSRRQFLLANDSAPPPGSTLVQPDLAHTLQSIADSGWRVFYQGYIADLIVAEMERGGGMISKEDLAAYRPEWREPITFTYRGHTIYTMAPSSSGGVTMAEMLNILEGYDPVPPFASAEQVHILTESMRRAFIDRNSILGDPAFVDLPIARLLLKPYAAKLRATIERDRATPTPPDGKAIAHEGNETTHYSVVDAMGNAVSVTTTLNNSYGSAVTVAGAGFLLNDEMDDFTTAPGKPNMYGLIQGEANSIAPGKRMLSAMTPTIVLDPRGELEMVLGTPGGPTIITTVAQVISNVIDHHMPMAQAVAAPRIHHQALPDTIRFEPNGLLPATVDRLIAMGHAIKVRPGSGFSGDVAAIERTRAGWVGVADPRRGAGAVGY
ncbi:MAG: gamma-glutamyltransferase [Gemmatimonadetes bacterium]|nr:gamma-glutamyltransferase [Gemmatimonadota bacterium]